MLKLVIGIPTYNSEACLDRTYDSLKQAIIYLLSQFKIYIEIYIIPNGCTDQTVEIASKLSQKNNDYFVTKIFIIKHKSKASALNFLRELKFDIIGYIDDDIYLDKKVFVHLIKKLLDYNYYWSVFAPSYPIKPRKDKGFYKRFIYNTLTIRIRYNLLSDEGRCLIGRCVFTKKNKMPIIPKDIYNEDQYIDYLLYPHVAMVKETKIFYESIYTIKDYFYRDLRITAGRKDVDKLFSKNFIRQYNKGRSKKINYRKLFSLPFRQILSFFLYRFVYKISKLIVKIVLFFNPKPNWRRT